MPDSHPAIPTSDWIEGIHKRFRKTTSCFTQDDASFKPKPELYSVAAQIAHVAHTVDWFSAPAFENKPFDLDFESMAAQANAVTTLADAFDWLDRAFASLKQHAASIPPAEINKPLIPADAPLMPNATLPMILSAIEDHTAHHRGSLAVYARLLNKVPPMPYM